MIFRHVKIPCYQVCLALTCKVMANAASVPTVMTKWRGWRDKTYLFYLFQKMPRPGADIAYYIPSHLQLCRACFRFRPIRREHPVEKVQSEKGDGQNAIRVWWECPDCSARGYMTYNSEAWYQDARGRQCPELKYRMDKP